MLKAPAIAQHDTSTMSSSFLYLASQSPRRRQLLEQLGVRYRLLPLGDALQMQALEKPHVGEMPAAYVQRVTAAKLQWALQLLECEALVQAPVLCADTTVTLNGQILGKPATAKEARAMLSRLSGHDHEVLTAIAVSRPQAAAMPLEVIQRSRVSFGVIPEADLQSYLAGDEWRDKAGAYGIQGWAARWIRHISGSYSGIMGLPLFETARLLRQAGVSF